MKPIKLFCLVLLLTFIAVGCESKPTKSLHRPADSEIDQVQLHISKHTDVNAKDQDSQASLHDAVSDKDTAELLTAEKMAAIAEIEKLGGTIKVDANSPNKPVTAVYFVGPITDADLVHLKGLAVLVFCVDIGLL